MRPNRDASRAFDFARISESVVASVAGLVVFAMPRWVLACAVCTSGREDESNTAFLISTIFLSLLPLAALGTLVFVLWRRIRALEQKTPVLGEAASSASVAAIEEAGPSALPIA